MELLSERPSVREYLMRRGSRLASGVSSLSLLILGPSNMALELARNLSQRFRRVALLCQSRPVMRWAGAGQASLAGCHRGPRVTAAGSRRGATNGGLIVGAEPQ